METIREDYRNVDFNEAHGESVMIGDNIGITILGIKGKHVRLGIDAPREIGVHREEIYIRIQQEKACGAPIPVTVGED